MEFTEKQVRLGNSFQSASGNFKGLQLLILSAGPRYSLSHCRLRPLGLSLHRPGFKTKAESLILPQSSYTVVPELHTTQIALIKVIPLHFSGCLPLKGEAGLNNLVSFLEIMDSELSRPVAYKSAVLQ